MIMKSITKKEIDDKTNAYRDAKYRRYGIITGYDIFDIGISYEDGFKAALEVAGVKIKEEQE